MSTPNKLEFTVSITLPDGIVFAPGADTKFFALELTIFTMQLMSSYSAGAGGTDVKVSVPDMPVTVA
ncbi:MAG TPA: hypothetical protein VEH04_11425 [Verrucomicrobiae bacterium]|nr:hypothetical protein [Verrucomicrobiae bacterium]